MRKVQIEEIGGRTVIVTEEEVEDTSKPRFLNFLRGSFGVRYKTNKKRFIEAETIREGSAWKWQEIDETGRCISVPVIAAMLDLWKAGGSGSRRRSAKDIKSDKTIGCFDERFEIVKCCDQMSECLPKMTAPDVGSNEENAIYALRNQFIFCPWCGTSIEYDVKETVHNLEPQRAANC